MSSGRSRGEELRWCHDAVVDVSRTFAITVDQLEPPMSDRICVGYLLCRIADTVEDAGHIPSEKQVELLDHYRETLDGERSVESFRTAVDTWIPDEQTRSADWDVVADVNRVFNAFDTLPKSSQQAIAEPASELVSGMSMFVDRYSDTGGLRIKTVEELEEYCWYAAGTVGQLITNLLTEDASEKERKTMANNAESFALLLQLVNIAKDVGDDYREENNVYLPAEWLDDVGIAQEEVSETQNADAVGSVVQRVVDRANGYLDDAQEYLMAMPDTQGNTLAAWAIPKLLAVGTIRELQKQPDQVVNGDVKVSRAEVYALIQRFESGVPREQIPDLRSTMEREPLHLTEH